MYACVAFTPCDALSMHHHFPQRHMVDVPSTLGRCMRCDIPRDQVPICEPTRHDYLTRPNGVMFCVRCGRDRILAPLSPTTPFSWETLLLLISYRADRKDFRRILPRLCKDLPNCVLIYLAHQKYLARITRPISVDELPAHFGYAFLSTRARRGHDASIDWDVAGRVFSNGISTYQVTVNESKFLYLDGPNTGTSRMFLSQISSIWRDDSETFYWHVDIVTMMDIVIQRMEVEGKVNIQTVKDIATNTLGFFESGEYPGGEYRSNQFARVYFAANAAARQWRTEGKSTPKYLFSSVAPPYIERNLKLLHNDIETYISTIPDTFPHFPCDDCLTQLD